LGNNGRSLTKIATVQKTAFVSSVTKTLPFSCSLHSLCRKRGLDKDRTVQSAIFLQPIEAFVRR